MKHEIIGFWKWTFTNVYYYIILFCLFLSFWNNVVNDPLLYPFSISIIITAILIGIILCGAFLLLIFCFIYYSIKI